MPISVGEQVFSKLEALEEVSPRIIHALGVAQIIVEEKIDVVRVGAFQIAEFFHDILVLDLYRRERQWASLARSKRQTLPVNGGVSCLVIERREVRI